MTAPNGVAAPGRLDGKVAIVTGAASGIGLGSATVLAERGASVIVADLRGDPAAEVADKLNAGGLSATSVAADVSDESQVASMIEAAVKAFGGLDILHNNAAATSPDIVGRDTDVVDIDAELFLTILRVNVLGYALATKHAIPRMLDRGGGVIINTSSAAAHSAEMVRPMYATSKAAILGWTRNVATQYGRHGIRCVSISPGFIVTPGAKAIATTETPIAAHILTPRKGRPHDIGNLVAFLASAEAQYLTGIDIPADGGMLCHFPNYAEATGSVHY
jgi:NAD(P)-dependent dehydrogenase (short-subunit alcohol dehydrogenase family)